MTCPREVRQTGDLVHGLQPEALTTHRANTDGAPCVAVGRVASFNSGVTMGVEAVHRENRKSGARRTGRTSTAALISFVLAGTLLTACSNGSGVRVETPEHDEDPSMSSSLTGRPSTSSAAPTDSAAAPEAQVQEGDERYYVIAQVGAASDPDPDDARLVELRDPTGASTILTPAQRPAGEPKHLDVTMGITFELKIASGSSRVCPPSSTDSRPAAQPAQYSGARSSMNDPRAHAALPPIGGPRALQATIRGDESTTV